MKGRESKERAMADVVDRARQKWPIYFSKFYEVTMISGESSRVFAADRFATEVVFQHTSHAPWLDVRFKQVFDLDCL